MFFTKRKPLGGVHFSKEVIDWEAVGGAIAIGLIVLAVIGALNG